MTGERHGGGALLAWLAFLATAVAGLHAVGGTLASPPLTRPVELGDWLSRHQPAQAAFAVVRLLTLGLAWYLLVTTVAGCLTRLIGSPALVRAADAVTVSSVRRLVNGVAGVSLAAATFTAGTGPAAAGTEGSPPSSVPVPASSHPATAAPATPAPAGGQISTLPSLPAVPTLRRLPDAPTPPLPSPPQPQPQASPLSSPPPPQAPPPPSPPSGPAPVTPGSWEVRPGDHFWAIAHQVLSRAWPRTPSDADVDGYWRDLIGANRSLLRDPDNHDLLYPGQVLTVPAPPPPPEPGA